MGGGASLGDEALDGGDDAVGVDAVGGLDAEGLSGELVDDVEQLDAAQVGGLVELDPVMAYVLEKLKKVTTRPSASRGAIEAGISSNQISS